LLIYRALGARDLSSKREGEALAMISVKTDRKADFKITKVYWSDYWNYWRLLEFTGDY